MYAATHSVLPKTTLWLEVRGPFGLERWFDFEPGCDRVRLIGAAAGVDVPVPSPFPVHSYFERDGDSLVLVLARHDAFLQVNGERVMDRVIINTRTSIYVGSSKLEVGAFEAPGHGVTSVTHDTPTRVCEIRGDGCAEVLDALYA